MEYEHSQSIAISFQIQFESVAASFVSVANEMKRPFMLLKPKLVPDGDMWIALYGDNLQEGVAASGKTPAEAAQNFDLAWLNQTLKKE